MKRLRKLLVVLALMSFSLKAQQPEEQQDSIYTWPKTEIIDNYFLLQDDYDQATNVIDLLNQKNINLSNQIVKLNTVLLYTEKSAALQVKLDKLEKRKKILRAVLISSLSSAVCVIGVDIWLTKKFN